MTVYLQDSIPDGKKKEFLMKQLASFSDTQLEFLSVISLFESPVSIDVVEAIRPITPNELRNLLERGGKSRILKTVDHKNFSIEKNVSSTLRENVYEYYSEAQLSHLLYKIDSLNLSAQLSPSVRSNLLIRKRNEDKSSKGMIKKAYELLENGYNDAAQYYLGQALYRTLDDLKTPEDHELFINAVFDYSKLCILLGRDFIDSAKFLEKAKTLSKTLGSKRAWALSNLHLGYAYTLIGRRSKAFKILSIGNAAVEALGDQDILTESSEFIAHYLFLQGKYKETIDFIELTERNRKLSSKTLTGLISIIKGYSLIYLGSYSQAIGLFYSAWQESLREGQKTLINTIQAALGTVYVLINQYEDAYFHLQNALKQHEKSGYPLARYTTFGGLAFFYYRKKDFQKTYLMMNEVAKEGISSGIVFTSPWYIEMIADLEKLGFPKIPGLELETQLKRILDEPNQYMQGVALRILAERASTEGKGNKSIWKNLQESEELLEKWGDPLQLSKTRLEMAKFMSKAGKKEEAKQLLSSAYAATIGQREDMLPDGLRPLLERYGISTKSLQSAEEMVIGFQTMIIELPLSPTPIHALEKLVSASCRFFGAERGGIFLMDSAETNGLSLRAACNLSLTDNNLPCFKNNLQLLRKVFKQKQPIIEHMQVIEHSPTRRIRRGSILCLPFYANNGISGVIYYDNSSMEDCFSIFQDKHLLNVCKFLEHYIFKIFEFNHKIENTKQHVLEKTFQIENQPKQEFIIRGRAMTQVIEQAMNVALTDGTVLITGETGVGKELLARFIRNKSNRNKWPIVTIDCTTIPENLFESELFGYEKGSFTGADQKKIGLVELADKGTLYIDEIGEMSLFMQAKLLRLLQEKHFKRIGGHQMIPSNFRLIAASNRNLLDEVKRGTFRKDLYYRLNVFPITIPPLRDRKDEIVFIAEQFLDRYVKKYGRPVFTLSKDNCRQLIDYSWPGNVRELENIIERAVLTSMGSRLNLFIPSDNNEDVTDAFDDNLSLDELQRRYILYILKKTNGKISGAGGAVDILRIKRSTLNARMRKLGIRM